MIENIRIVLKNLKEFLHRYIYLRLFIIFSSDDMSIS